MIDQVLSMGRAAALARMKDACEITMPGTGPSVRDPATGTVTLPPPLVLYGPDIAPHHGRCRIRMSNANAAIMQNGEQGLGVQQAPLSVPIDTVLPKGAKVTILASDDPGLVGTVRTIKALHHASQSTAHRYQFEEIA